MLDELRIRGLGVIDNAVLPLGPGLTVVTGETGAGKTMVVTGLLLLFGSRADAARVRGGAEQASVDGRLTVAPDSAAALRVRAAGGALDDGTDLILRRVVSAAGRSRAYVGGAAAPVAVLGDLAAELVAVHGQADQLRLARPGAQRDALDRYAGVDRAQFTAAYDEWRSACAALAERTARAAQLMREADVLTRGLAEIAAAAPQAGEAEELTALAARLGHADTLTCAARVAHDALVGDPDDPIGAAPDVSGLLASAARVVAQQRSTDPELDALATRLLEVAALAADLGADFGGYVANLDADPERLEHVEQRRATLAGLVRRYCDEPEPTVAGVLRWADTARARLVEIDVSDEAIAELRRRCGVAQARVVTLGEQLSLCRRDAASALARAVTAELSGLAMPGARVQVEVTLRPPGGSVPSIDVGGTPVGVSGDGFDEVAILLQPHSGAPALPLGRGASGGELSRVMLALEVSLAGTGTVPTLIFDEVDAGVGGRAAAEVGRRLARLARERQVIVVTHLAQVAAYADRHIIVDKPTGGAVPDALRPTELHSVPAVTASDVREVGGDHRVAELARMLAGSNTETAREHAAELLARSAAERRDSVDTAVR